VIEAGKRLLAAVPTLFAVITVVFLILHVLPGDPAAVLLGGAPSTPSVIRSLRQQLGLNASLPDQYWRYLRGLATGNLGTSYVTDQPVTHMIAQALPSTLELAGTAVVISMGAGTALGILSAVRARTWVDGLVRVVSQVGVSVPSFWSGILLVLVFSVRLRWFPSVGGGGVSGLVLPAVTLSFVGTALLSRIVRASVLETMGQPFVLQLHAKGLRPAAVYLRHVLRSGLIASLTTTGLLLAEMLAGTVVIETVFSRQGIGRLLVTSISSKDLPVVQGIILLIAVLYILLNVAVDLSYPLIDPRLRGERVRSRAGHVDAA
jgi:ABC-type dipeptide/oligopeptide/nickel transport system permease component